MMMRAQQRWILPKNLPELLIDDDEGGMWEDDRWSPILLTIMKGTSYEGREIPLAWQFEFEPHDEACVAANKKIKSLGVDPDGYGWADVLKGVFADQHPEIVDELHFGDTESDACVVWVEAANTCRLISQ